jgi:hypothetical protein
MKRDERRDGEVDVFTLALYKIPMQSQPQTGIKVHFRYLFSLKSQYKYCKLKRLTLIGFYTLYQYIPRILTLLGLGLHGIF